MEPCTQGQRATGLRSPGSDLERLFAGAHVRFPMPIGVNAVNSDDMKERVEDHISAMALLGSVCG